MIRFLALSVPTVVLLLALGQFVWGALGWAPDTILPQRLQLGTWLLESVGLTALFLLLTARGGSRWLAAVAAPWVAWVFRGPLVVLTMVGATAQAHEPWWRLSLGWLAVYTVSGIFLALLYGRPARADSEAPPPPDPYDDLR